MDELKSGSTAITWDPGSRLAVISYGVGDNGKGKDARPLVEAWARWVGPERRPFYLLSDCANLDQTDADFHALWWGFYRRHHEDIWIAIYNVKPVLRVVAEMFQLATGLHLRVFKGEAEARAWLMEMGAPL